MYAGRGEREWEGVSSQVYPRAEQLLSCADSNSSNSYRVRPWKEEVQHWANETHLHIAVYHLPPGTSI